MPYVDGFIVAVPKQNLAVYTALSKKCGKVWREYGALDYREWVADDVKVGKLTSFPRSVKLKPGETVVFAWITYKSRAQRDKINAKVMAVDGTCSRSRSASSRRHTSAGTRPPGRSTPRASSPRPWPRKLSRCREISRALRPSSDSSFLKLSTSSMTAMGMMTLLSLKV